MKVSYLFVFMGFLLLPSTLGAVEITGMNNVRGVIDLLPESVVTSYINNTNKSDFWDNLDTPLDITDLSSVVVNGYLNVTLGYKSPNICSISDGDNDLVAKYTIDGCGITIERLEANGNRYISGDIIPSYDIANLGNQTHGFNKSYINNLYVNNPTMIINDSTYYQLDRDMTLKHYFDNGGRILTLIGGNGDFDTYFTNNGNANIANKITVGSEIDYPGNGILENLFYYSPTTSWRLGTGGTPASIMHVYSQSNTPIVVSDGQILLSDTRAVTQGVGGAVVMRGIWHTSGSETTSGAVNSFKMNSLSGGYDFGLAFLVRNVSLGYRVDMLLSDEGYLGVHNSYNKPLYPLEVHGDTGGITAWFEKNISVEEIVYHTPTHASYNRNYLEDIGKPTSMIQEDGRLNRSILLDNEKTMIPNVIILGYENITTEIDVPVILKNGTGITERRNQTIQKKITGLEMIEGTKLTYMAENNRLLVAELKEKIEQLENRITELESSRPVL